ncbi:protein FAR-RED IMPAIRED RESPONSE 1-like [Lotus japonicus]|uniref:protein FAR-RED IMPAIRED RESPONSE 1-like n=1 Tax=Lotus japonicus TaxID=34305 RepID=UPI002586CB0C|nr:protein FAR-RED IMPAIRED RESPONSE 1-like [Lotus japonicus]
MDVKSVLEQYVLKRWTKLARSGELPNGSTNHVEKDAHLSTTQSYAEICPHLIRIATEACRSKETTVFLNKVVDLLENQMLEFQKKEVNTTEIDVFLGKVKEIGNNNDSSTQVIGFKKKEGRKGSKRLKSWVENQHGKRKKNSASRASQSQQHTKGGSDVLGASSASQSLQRTMGGNDTLSQFGINNFTNLLMAEDDEDITTLINT